ncbi:uncharacterized protein LAESUDRAFT_177259 [Laetiporus sulphureus 93-53]|uniref:CASTOR ACT domain-containing protein n=1 Tax=Laetiporus sulphureus 93-53 TaxID=1314785 RepID=A0A165E823_9APHY|nr:uncharacterized protein LAESUDRAFT_177259 [Laetiporus sulphureus 93-53]KZT06423.1 hypothetical protein LAESUDRAFT_177259 [Laetiporus sulphureus 93-53]
MAENVTISLLPVSLALVHLPRSRLESLTTHVLSQILLPNPTFLNITCNEIELSLFAEHHVLKDFEKIAKKDAHKLAKAMKESTDEQSRAQVRRRRRKHVVEHWEPVEVSSDRWSVLQIDSHSDQLDNSGARVRELSAPLAAAGISILYQSSYMSDFIFVKSARLSQVMSLLASAGFNLYSSDPTNFTAQLSTFTSPLLSPTPDDNSSISLLDLTTVAQRVDPEGRAIFTRSRSGTDSTSISSGSRGTPLPPLLHMSGRLDFAFPADPTVSSPISVASECDEMKTPAPAPKSVVSRSQSHSPSGCEVSLLAPDLTYVGLADEHVDMWGLKIIKLVAFPRLIVGGDRSTESLSSGSSSGGTRFLSSSPSAVDFDAAVAPPVFPTNPLDEVSLRIITASDVGNTSGSDTTTRVGLDSPKEELAVYDSAEATVSELRRRKKWEEGSEQSSDDENTSPSSDEEGDSEAKFERERSSSASSSGRPSLAHYDTLDTLYTLDTVMTVETVRPAPVSESIESTEDVDAAKRSRSPSTSSSSSSSSSASISPPPLVPFFSFTRTTEGSSLTAPVSLLAALFPPDQRHMVICSDELDVLDSRQSSPAVDEEEALQDAEEDDADRGPQGPLKCLQIDLRKFGLDKYGLVNRFSRTLEENGINHIYNSTFKTANLLVDKAHATRAQALLRSC